MSDGIDISELTEFRKLLGSLALEKKEKETKKFLQKEGNKLKRKTVQTTKKVVKQKTGNLIKGIKRGKPYKYLGTDLSVRVYGASPHSHLIEYGHRQVVQDGRTNKNKKSVKFKRAGTEVGFVKGYRVFEKAAVSFEEEFTKDCETFLDDLLEKGGLH